MVRYEIKQEYKDKIEHWYEHDNKRIFIISGYAGTGKTTLARSIPDLLKVSSTAFLAPTGKAALLMVRGRTIHSYLYNVHKNEETGEIRFMMKGDDEFTDSLLIIDEVSMVSDELMADLISTGIPIIGLGDSAQLPPVNGDNSLLDRADIFLTEIHRSDDGIVNLATDIRKDNKLQLKYDGVKFSSRKFINDIGEVDKDSIIICKFNKTRKTINQAYRRFHIPEHRFILVPGERLIITRNNSSSGLMNGSIVTLNRVLEVDVQGRKAIVEITDDSGSVYPIRLDMSQILNQMQLPSNQYDRYPDLHDCDYAYAITCHKAQGSEFEKVFIVNEGKGYGDHRAWFYTAVTRAKKEVRIYNYG